MLNELLEGVHKSWHGIITPILQSQNGQDILQKLEDSKKSTIVYPPNNLILHAFRLSPLHKVKVCILGQDPYHGEGQAMGLAFSVPETIKKLPPSLVRILREAGVENPKHGNLTVWAQQGVLLLNPVLTVAKAKPGSHEKWGWNAITDKVIYELSKTINDRKLIFLLWGNKAQEKRIFIDERKHEVIVTAHPSPLATKGGFVGSGCFLKTNELLQAQGLAPIDWSTSADRVQAGTESELSIGSRSSLSEDFLNAAREPMPFPTHKCKKLVKKTLRRNRLV